MPYRILRAYHTANAVVRAEPTMHHHFLRHCAQPKHRRCGESRENKGGDDGAVHNVLLLYHIGVYHGSMNKFQKLSLVALRVVLGWMFFYAGITKVLDPEWSAAGYLNGAKAFVGFYGWLASPGVLPITNFVNEWGLTLLGASLILGVGVRLASYLGAAMMVLYWLPLGLPYPNEHAYIVDEHIIYAATLLVLASLRAGRVFGLENWCSRLPICSRYPKLRSLLG
jgi:thiosulfate dehydrogenase [quinone] large subunit